MHDGNHAARASVLGLEGRFEATLGHCANIDAMKLCVRLRSGRRRSEARAARRPEPGKAAGQTGEQDAGIQTAATRRDRD